MTADEERGERIAWATEADRIAYARELLMHGRAFKTVGSDGLTRHIPLLNVFVQPPEGDHLKGTGNE